MGAGYAAAVAALSESTEAAEVQAGLDVEVAAVVTADEVLVKPEPRIVGATCGRLLRNHTLRLKLLAAGRQASENNRNLWRVHDRNLHASHSTKLPRSPPPS
jgi:hypothetical protein